MLQAVKEIFADQAARPKPIIDAAAPVPLKPVAVAAPQLEAPAAAIGTAAPDASAAGGRAAAGGIEVAAAAPQLEAPAGATGTAAPDAGTAGGRPVAGGIEVAAAGWIEAGVKLIESIAGGGGAGTSGGASGSRLEEVLSGLFTRDARTNRPVLSIPLPESLSQERLTAAISGLVNTLGRAVSPAGK